MKLRSLPFTTAAISTIALLCINALTASAASVENFNGYKPGEFFSPGEVLPSKGTGWTDGWRSANSYVQVSANFVTSKPVDAGAYLAVSYLSNIGEKEANPSGAVTLPYRSPTVPFKVSFKFRPDVPDKNIRYFLFDNDVRAANTSPAASWLIVSKDGFWELLDGEQNGLPQEMVATKVPVIAGTVYTFTLDVNSQTRVWSVTINDGKRSSSFKNLHFRSFNFTPDRCLVFGANETTSPSLGLTVRFSLDTISIQP